MACYIRVEMQSVEILLEKFPDNHNAHVSRKDIVDLGIDPEHLFLRDEEDDSDILYNVPLSFLRNRTVGMESYINLASEVVKDATKNKHVKSSTVRLLSKAGLMDSSTNFRKYSLFPGEESIFRVQIVDGTEVKSYIIGFDKNDQLISIDIRNLTPSEEPLPHETHYRGENGWQSDRHKNF